MHKTFQNDNIAMNEMEVSSYFLALGNEKFLKKKNSFSIENDYIKSWWWCGLNADSIIEQPDTEKKFTLVIEQRDCANYILYIQTLHCIVV